MTATLTRARARTAGAGCRRRRRVQRRPCTMLWPRPLESARQYASTPPSGVRAAGGKQRERAASLLLVVRALRTTMTSGAYRRVLTLCTTDRRSRCATQQDPCPIRPEERSNASQATRVQGEATTACTGFLGIFELIIISYSPLLCSSWTSTRR